MEVVACFLQKYFSLLANNEVQSVKDLYASDAVVSVTINGERTSSTGSALVDKIEALFANGTVTISDVQQVSAPESIVLTASGSVEIEGSTTSFTQQVTLFHAAKTWYIAFEQIDAQVTEKPVAEPVVEEPVVEKAPTPQRSPAVKPKKETVAVPKEKVEEKAMTPVEEKPAVAAPPKVAPIAGSWAAVAVTTSDKPKPKAPVVAVASTPVKVATPAVNVPNVGIHFTLNFTDAIRAIRANGRDLREQDTKIREVVTNEIYPLFAKCGLSKESLTRVHSVVKDPKILVFVDCNVADALEKLLATPPLVLGQRINPTLQKSEGRKM